ncbi:hypothetical protein RXV94_04645 [Yeosuana sp. MJ-SS3]|uniref:Uncharacterized protein n=1 Tax=Gilvirhabdus luticola TaxID=3079858 RepID=A0ABU3U4V3_9FLAO|nr:hypothetical protein [Yeosuana sp. MJ-SS3]MDU8885439.1 hypothetical protein [Yeosuana sp. MJ-SS3]
MTNHQMTNIKKHLTLYFLFLVIVTYAQPNEDFNFMIGNWDIEAKIRQNEIHYIHGKGTMNVYYNQSKDSLFADMRVKFQNFEVIGTTIRTYNNKTERWDVSWNPESGHDV